MLFMTGTRVASDERCCCCQKVVGVITLLELALRVPMCNLVRMVRGHDPEF